MQLLSYSWFYENLSRISPLYVWVCWRLISILWFFLSIILCFRFTSLRRESEVSFTPYLALKGFFFLESPQKCEFLPLPARTLSLFHHVQLSVTLWMVAGQAALSVGFSRQEHWSGLPCPTPGDLPDAGIKPTVFCACWTGRRVLYRWRHRGSPSVFPYRVLCNINLRDMTRTKCLGSSFFTANLATA